MKKLMISTLAALAMGATAAFAEDAPVDAASAAPVDAGPRPRQTQTTAVSDGRGQGPASTKAARPKMTEAQRAEMRARREKFMAERKAAMEAKMLAVILKYVPEEEKAKALMKELEDSVLMGRRMPKGHPLPPPARPAAAK